jgi:hypothetical protein
MSSPLEVKTFASQPSHLGGGYTVTFKIDYIDADSKLVPLGIDCVWSPYMPTLAEQKAGVFDLKKYDKARSRFTKQVSKLGISTLFINA